MYKNRIFIAVLLLIALVLSACQPAATPTPEEIVKTVIVEKEGEKVVETVLVTPEAEEEEEEGKLEPIKIGFVGDFSGFWALSERPARDGALFAVDEINKTGGVLGRPLVLLTRDGQDDSALTVRLVEELINEGVVYIMGTVGDPIVAEGSVACEAGIPISTGIGSAPNLVPDMGDCAFMVIWNDTIQAGASAQHAYENGYRSAYLLRSNEFPYVEDLPTYFADAFEHYGGEVLGEEQFRVDAGDYSAIVTTITGLDPAPDVIYSPQINPDSVLFMRQLRSAGVEVPVYTPDTNDAPNVLDGGEAVENMPITTHGFPLPDSELKAFYDRYEEAKGQRPDTVFYALGYDEIYALKQAIEDAGSAEPSAIMEAMENLTNFEGLTGTWSMNPETHMAEKPVTLIAIEDGEFIYLDSFYPDYVPEP